MCFQLTRLALKIKGLKASEKLVLLSLADRADAEGRSWPSVRTIGLDADLSPRAVQGALRRLESLRLIHRTPRTRGDGSQTSSIFTVQLAPAGIALPPAGNAVEGANTAPSVPQKLLQAHAQTAPHEPINESTNANQLTQARNRGELFEEIWRDCPEYLRKRSAKAKALKTFNAAANAVGVEPLVQAIKAYVSSPDVVKGYGKALERWLGDGRHCEWIEPPVDEPTAVNSERNAIHRVWMDGWVRDGYWPAERGPKPGQAGCILSPSLLAEFNLAPCAEIIPLKAKGAA